MEKRVGIRFLAILAVVGAFAVGAGAGSLWRESANTCRLAGVLLEDIRSLLKDGHEVLSDPFLEYSFGSEETLLSRIDLERELAQRILARFGRFHLSLGFLIDLDHLAELRLAPSLAKNLETLESWRHTIHPDPGVEGLLENLSLPGAPGVAAGLAWPEPWYSDPTLARAKLRELAESDHRRIEEARSRIPELKAEWSSDSLVYCRSNLTLHRMQLVEDAQKEACAKSKSRCAVTALGRFHSEIDQLESVRSLNEKKLRQKWGENLYAEIRCN